MISPKNKMIDLSRYEVIEKLRIVGFLKFYLISNIETGKKYLAKYHKNRKDRGLRDYFFDLSRELRILSKINHSSFLKFHGYSLRDFKNNENPVIILEYPQNETLYELLDFPSDCESSQENLDSELQSHETLNLTQKLIIIYGIAAGMSYLHSYNVIHRNLSSSVIFLDENYYPKILGLEHSKEMNRNEEFAVEMKPKFYEKHYAPEYLLHSEYSKASDVYSFGLLLYSIMTNEEPYSDIKCLDLFEKVGIQKARPKISEKVPLCYRHLIEKCWSDEPKERPTFSEIVSQLKSNTEFLIEGINNDEYQKYIKFIEESQNSFISDSTFDEVDSILHKLEIFPKSDILAERLKYSNTTLYADLEEFTDTKLDCKYIHLEEISSYTRNEILNIARCTNIISQIDHPSIIKFLGFSSVDFNNKPRPIIFREARSKLSLSHPLFGIYSIALGMSFLHSHNIIHRNLKLDNIFSSPSNIPIIDGFDIAKEIDGDKTEPNETIKGSPAYIAPEVYLHQGYSKASDVYSFGLLVYELLMKKEPFKDFYNPSKIKKGICENNYRPAFLRSIPRKYQELIERCWSSEIKQRPTFDEIVYELKTDPEYITDEIPLENYRQFVQYLDEFPVRFDPNKRVKIFDDILQSKLLTFPNISASYPLTDIYHTQDYDVPMKIDVLEYNDIHFLDDFKNGVNYESYKYINTKTNEIYIALRSIKNPLDFYQNEIINFTRQLNILLQLKHPAIIDFIGYKFYDILHPILVMPFSEKGSLDDILYNDKSLNCTQKLKIIYGIASGMSYLHLHGIIHRDLKSGNIYFDDLLHPKISGFNIAKEINGDKTEPNETIKGSPAYIASEVYLHQGYSKASDVYSFGLLVYELLMEERPYKILQNPSQIKKEICENNYRPVFSSSVPRKYQELAERCWSSEIKKRPTFDAIVYELKNDPDYITSDVDKGEFERYVEFIDQSPIYFNSSKRIENIEELVKFKIKKFDPNDRKINFRNIYETETNNISFDLDYIDLRTFEKEKLIQKRKLFKLHEVLDKKTNKRYISKSIVKEKNALMNILLHKNNSWADDVFKMISEIELISEINHPSILNFVGYSSFDFKGRSYPVIITENASNGSLEKILEFDQNKDDDFILDDTKKLIIIYGIASALSYLHSHDIIHCNLNPTNIFVDDFLFPKIAGFYDSKKHSKNCNRDSEEYYKIPTELSFDDLIFLGTYYTKIDCDIYKSPMMYFSKKNSTLDDVYSFGMIMYRLIAGDIPFSSPTNKRYKKKAESLIDQIYTEQLRPSFIHPVPECFRNLIEKCWGKNPDEVPTFDEIVYHLRTNKAFITDKVNEEEFLNYVNFIEKSQNSFGNQNKQIDDFIQTQNQNFRKIKINFSKLINWKKLPYSVDVGTIDINDFKKLTKIGSGGFGSVYKVVDNKKNSIYAAKISIYQIDQCSEDMIVNLSREVDIISSLRHPCICQFIGYSPNNFKNVSKPVIITEFVPNGSLDNFIEMERNGLAHPDWDDTKKLINIFGIASGMKYLHDHDIIHRDLKPANILIDEMLYPKIADFGLSKKIPGESNETNEKIVSSGFKGTYAYCAPEIAQRNEYSLKSDVYAFGIIVYEILTSNILYEGFNQFTIILEISKGFRMEFDQSIPYCYRKLINKCCSYDPEERPHFSEIVRDLKTDPRFITKNVNEEDFLNYVSLIEEEQNDESLKPQNMQKVTFVDHIHETENVIDKAFLDLSKYERGSIIYKGHEFKIYHVQDKEKKESLIAQVSMMNAKKIPESTRDDLISEIKALKQMNHPAIMRFIGFSPVDFKNDRKSVTIMESFANGTLEDILEIRRNGVAIPEWNSTKKLINIYGIAAGMSYLHSHDVVHRCLSPLSIYLDDSLLPKIGNFGLSTRFFGSDSMTQQSMTGLKGSPIYYAPEIIQSNKYTKKSDVYAFSFILYEILMEEKPFHEISNVNSIFTKVVIDKKRPIIKDTIPKTYRNLIEKCWADDPSERPTFDDIVHILKMDLYFIDKDFRKEDFLNYINFIDEQTLHQTNKVNEYSSKIIEKDEENRLPLTILHHQQEAEKGNIECQEFLAKKYSKEKDAERTYKYFCMLIKNGRCDIPLEYAVRLYKAKQYEQAFYYFRLLSKVNHPIAQYFIGEMKFCGKGCIENCDESYGILKHLSDNGIDRATEFLKCHFGKH